MSLGLLSRGWRRLEAPVPVAELSQNHNRFLFSSRPLPSVQSPLSPNRAVRVCVCGSDAGACSSICVGMAIPRGKPQMGSGGQLQDLRVAHSQSKPLPRTADPIPRRCKPPSSAGLGPRPGLRPVPASLASVGQLPH